MQVKQIYELTNTITKEVLGETAVVAEDLSNIVDLGKAIFNANQVENYTKKLVDRIGRVVFVDRAYAGRVPSLLMDSWEWGSVMQKISGELPEAVEAEEWELVDGASYDPNVVTLPKVENKFFNSKLTFEVDVTITEDQCKSAFTSATAYNAFVSMIYGLVEKSMTLKISNTIMRAINNVIAETIHDGNSVRAVNLLSLYNTEKGTTLTADKCLKDTEFLKYASYTLGIYCDRMADMSKLFNINGRERFTPRDYLKIVALTDFVKGCDSYLQSDTFHNDMVKLPEGIERVPYWQGSGTSYAFADISKVNVKTASGDSVSQSGILAVAMDKSCCAVMNPIRKVRTAYNAKGNFTNAFFVWESGLYNDLSENAVVFYVA